MFKKGMVNSIRYPIQVSVLYDSSMLVHCVMCHEIFRNMNLLIRYVYAVSMIYRHKPKLKQQLANNTTECAILYY